MDFEKDYLDEKEPLDVEEDFEKPELTKGATRDTDPQYFTNIDGIYAKDVAGRVAVEELRTLVTEYIGDYSTAERKIGKWIDGSDLYQRTFEVTGLVNGQFNNAVLGTSDIDIKTVDGYIEWTYNGNPNVRTSLDYYINSNDYVALHNAFTDINIKPNRTESGMVIVGAVITIKYTKPSVQANVLNANIQQTEEPTDEMR
jgi:hypothetical protein